MSEDIHKWSDGRYTLMFDEHTFFVWDNEKDERMCALQTTERLNMQQFAIEQLKSVLRKECNIITDEDLLEYVMNNGVSLNE